MWIDVVDAARELNVAARQVRRLAASGELAARRVGGVWLIDSDSVRSRRRRGPRAGRPLSEPMAWGAAALLAHCLPDAASGDEADAALRAIEPRMQRRLRQLLADPPAVEHWPQWMRNHSDRRRVYVHPGVLDHFGDDARVRVIDPSSLLGVGGAEQRFYVNASDLTGVLTDYRGKLDPEGPVDLEVFHDAGAQVLDRCPEAVAVAVAVQLVASPDARERHAARDVLREAVRELGALRLRQP